MMNNSFFQGSNSSVPDYGLSSIWVNALTTAYVITFLIAFPGNALGLLVVYRRRSFRNTMNLLIMNMCFADLLVMLIVTPLALSYLFTQARWLAGVIGDITCKISQYSFVVTIAASILTILFITLERFFAICYPLKGKLLGRPRVVTALIWVLAMLLMSPYVVLHKNVQLRDGTWQCTMWFGEDSTPKFMKIHYLLLFLILYAVPVLLIAALNSIIVFRLARDRIPGESSRQVALRFRYKAVKMLITLLAVFAICWLPTHLLHYLITTRRDILRRLPRGIPYLSFWLGYFNSALNPIIYVLLSDNFRKDFIKLVLRRAQHRKTTSTKATNSFVMSSRERSGSSLGRFSRRLSRESWNFKSFPRTPTFRHVNFFECMLPNEESAITAEKTSP